ncbi:MAG: hypothetical protein ACR2OO_04065 [Thermomicrobiales bacterium]
MENALAMCSAFRLPSGCTSQNRSPRSWAVSTLLGGLRVVISTKVIIAAITPGMFAVLFGGAARLPAFVKKTLHVGASGLGAIWAAPFALAGMRPAWRFEFPPSGQNKLSVRLII